MHVCVKNKKRKKKERERERERDDYACMSGVYAMITKKKTKKQNKNQIRVSLEWDPCKKKTTDVKE